jgi:hypothetical protein
MHELRRAVVQSKKSESSDLAIVGRRPEAR